MVQANRRAVSEACESFDRASGATLRLGRVGRIWRFRHDAPEEDGLSETAPEMPAGKIWAADTSGFLVNGGGMSGGARALRLAMT
jgi:hypothetical protein